MMKKIILGFCTYLSFLSMAMAQDFCLASRKIIPYSPLSRYSVECDGIEISQTSLFGHQLEEKFKVKLSAKGYKIVTRFESLLLVTKKSSRSLAKEICFTSKGFFNQLRINCDSGNSVTLDSDKLSVLEEFAHNYGYKILQRPRGNNDFYILGR